MPPRSRWVGDVRRGHMARFDRAGRTGWSTTSPGLGSLFATPCPPFLSASRKSSVLFFLPYLPSTLL